MVERFNGRISELLKPTRFTAQAELESALVNDLQTYNHHIAQRALQHKTPIQSLKQWQIETPDLFVKRVYKHAGLDT